MDGQHRLYLIRPFNWGRDYYDWPLWTTDPAGRDALRAHLRVGDFAGALDFVDKPELWHAYQAMWPDIPPDQRYAIFREIYARSESGFGSLDWRGLRRIFASRAAWAEAGAIQDALRRLADAKGSLTIYRGVGRHSTPADSALSWTTSLETAQWFARRYAQFEPTGDGGTVWRARVRADEVWDYLTDRDESEILVDPETLRDLEIVADPGTEKAPTSAGEGPSSSLC